MNYIDYYSWKKCHYCELAITTKFVIKFDDKPYCSVHCLDEHKNDTEHNILIIAQMLNNEEELGDIKYKFRHLDNDNFYLLYNAAKLIKEDIKDDDTIPNGISIRPNHNKE